MRDGPIRKIVAILFLCASAWSPAEAQCSSDARSLALACAVTALLGVSGLDANPAAWAGIERPGLKLDGTQLFGMPELRAASASVNWTAADVVVAIGVRTFGFDLYRETTAVFGAAHAFYPGTHRAMYAGIRLEERVIHIEGYGRRTLQTASVGLILPVTGSVTLGAVAENVLVFSPSLRDDAERSLSVGAGLTPAPSVLITADLVKEVRSPPSIRFGVETTPVSALAIRGGLTTDPMKASGGVGLQTAGLHVDLGAERHYALGWSPSISVRVEW